MNGYELEFSQLCTWRHDPVSRTLRLGAGVTYAQIERDPIASLVPGLAEAARTVGSPQIRHAATIGGNVGTCSPAGDGLPVLSAVVSRFATCLASFPDTTREPGKR